MSKRIWLVFCFFVFCLFSSNSIYGQSPGLVLQTGLTSHFSKDQIFTKSGQAHYGWMIGGDARLLEGSLYFIMGAQYHQTSFRSNKSFQISNDWKMMMFRGGLGFDIFRISAKSAIRSKILGSINYNLSTPENGLGISGYDVVNESFLGAVTGIGLTLGSLDIDLDYQYGIINTIYQKPDTKLNGLTLMLGFHF